jgi:hypothetical protein
VVHIVSKCPALERRAILLDLALLQVVHVDVDAIYNGSVTGGHRASIGVPSPSMPVAIAGIRGVRMMRQTGSCQRVSRVAERVVGGRGGGGGVRQLVASRKSKLQLGVLT